MVHPLYTLWWMHSIQHCNIFGRQLEAFLGANEALPANGGPCNGRISRSGIFKSASEKWLWADQSDANFIFPNPSGTFEYDGSQISCDLSLGWKMYYWIIMYYWIMVCERMIDTLESITKHNINETANHVIKVCVIYYQFHKSIRVTLQRDNASLLLVYIKLYSLLCYLAHCYSLGWLIAICVPIHHRTLTWQVIIKCNLQDIKLFNMLAIPFWKNYFLR